MGLRGDAAIVGFTELPATRRPTGPLEFMLEQWARLAAATEDLAAAVADHAAEVVVVTNEVGWGLVSEHRSGRLFADHLGRINQRIADSCDQVVLVVAGRPLVL